MNPERVDWKGHEKAVSEELAHCLGLLSKLDGEVCAFGIEGDVEQGLVNISANVLSHRNVENQWWLPDWSNPYLNDNLSSSALFQYGEQIAAIDYGENVSDVYEALCENFRSSCLRALRGVVPLCSETSFSQTSDFMLVYMDGDEALYRGVTEIEAGSEQNSPNG